MKEIITKLMEIRHLKPEEIEKEFEKFATNLKNSFPNDAELGKHIRKN